MRVPKVEHYTSGEDVAFVELQAPILIPRHPVITGDRQRKKMITRIERKCRSSMEYKDLIKYLRTNLHMDECAFLPNIKTGGRKNGLIQIHHSPFDLYTIADIVASKFEKENGYFNENLIAKEIMQLHYEGLIGLIPLTVTCHDLVHDGKLPVPLNCVYGRFIEFTQKYYEFIDTDQIAMLEEMIDYTKNLTKDDFSILQTRYIYTSTEGQLPLDELDIDSIEVEKKTA